MQKVRESVFFHRSRPVLVPAAFKTQARNCAPAPCLSNGRDEATRTPDPYVPNVVRYQLRYIPLTGVQNYIFEFIFQKIKLVIPVFAPFFRDCIAISGPATMPGRYGLRGKKRGSYIKVWPLPGWQGFVLFVFPAYLICRRQLAGFQRTVIFREDRALAVQFFQLPVLQANPLLLHGCRKAICQEPSIR